MTGIELKDWIETGLLSLVTLGLGWVVKDFMVFRTKTLPRLVTQDQCRTCQAAKGEDMKEIRDRLKAGREEFKEIAVFMARIDERLKRLDA